MKKKNNPDLAKAVISSDPAPNRFQRPIQIGVVIIVLLIGVGLYFQQKSDTKLDRDKVSGLAETGNCRKGLRAVRKVQADPNNSGNSIALLSYRASCQLQLERYPEAITTLKQLKPYYVKA